MEGINPMTTTLSPAAFRAGAEESYRDVEHVIKATVQRFVGRYGGNYDDLLADANTAYMLGYRATLEGRNNSPDFATEIKRWVWFELFDAYRVRSQYRRKDKVVVKQDEYIELLPSRRRTFDMVEFLDELSEDAKLAAALVLETPAELAAAARARGGGDHNLRCLIRAYLRGRGWSPARINASFDEIRVALT
jgi:hypothetical protein